MTKQQRVDRARKAANARHRGSRNRLPKGHCTSKTGVGALIHWSHDRLCALAAYFEARAEPYLRAASVARKLAKTKR